MNMVTACPAKIVGRINQSRIQVLRRELESGQRCDLELGCWSGRFAHALSLRTSRWVVGIDRDEAPMHGSKDFTLEDYRRAERFYYLRGPYERVLDVVDTECRWMRGIVSRTFMIMPIPKLFDEELDLWLQCSVPRGELHVRTEDPNIIDRLGAAIPHPWESIPFAPEALNIESGMTMIAESDGKEIHTFGFRLMPA